MTSGHIPDGESLFRQSIYPVTFRGNRYAPEKLLKLYDQGDGRLLVPYLGKVRPHHKANSPLRLPFGGQHE